MATDAVMSDDSDSKALCKKIEQLCHTEHLVDVSVSRNEEDGYLPWSDFFISLCHLTSARSKDPNRKVGACIVDKENRIVSLGYNGMPRGIDDSKLPWNRESEKVYDTKYPYVCHAEMNAIMNKRHFNLEDCTLYVSKFPCCECAKLIIQSGIKRVIFVEKKPESFDKRFPVTRMFNLAGIICKKYTPSVSQVNINMVDGEVKIMKQ